MVSQSVDRRRGIQFFSRHDPVGNGRLEMRPPVWDEAAVKALPEFFAGGGSAQVTLFADPAGSEDHCLNLIWLRLGSNYQLPRHSHTEDCLYYVVAGSVDLGNRTVGAGEGFFAPSTAPYSYVAGPEGAEILEFRGTARPVYSQVHETAAGWKRILAGVRANRDRWVRELKPYSRWCRSASSVDYVTPSGENLSLAIKR
ncbi:MAG: cupin [Acidimicrobiales bacterium]